MSRGQRQTTVIALLSHMERRRFLGHVQVRVPATQPSQQCA
jgi:hypothetical protein